MPREEPCTKRQKAGKDCPSSIVTWNCNGLVSRCAKDEAELQTLLDKTKYPDLICLQECRLKASSSSRGKPQESEYQLVQSVMEGTFSDYQQVWSLADKRYAGTLTLIHKRLAQQPKTTFTTQQAIDSLLQKFNLTRDGVGLKQDDPSPAPAVKQQKKQTSLTSFFAPKQQSTASSNFPALQKHHEEGRFQFLSFETMDLIQTYVPNNGTKHESFERRRLWDESLRTFLENRKAILAAAGHAHRPLLWTGDFNCAHTYRDGSHWKTLADGSIYEWWTDEAKCLDRKDTAGREKPLDCVGIPSFTPAERKRFDQMLREGNFVDVWRAKHPPPEQGSDNNDWEAPIFTWRGHTSKPGASFLAKYQGKGQRLDYFLLSPSNRIDTVDSCEILGYGTNREGLFCGSDHCAVWLQLSLPE